MGHSKNTPTAFAVRLECFLVHSNAFWHAVASYIAPSLIHGANQAFDYARSKAGDVSELFDVLKGKLRPGKKTKDGGEGEGAKASSGNSILRAHYYGSSGNTVLSKANLKRIQTFLDEPQKHLGQVRIGKGKMEIIRMTVPVLLIHLHERWAWL